LSRYPTCTGNVRLIVKKTGQPSWDRGDFRLRMSAGGIHEESEPRGHS